MQVFNCFMKILRRNLGMLLLYTGIFAGIAVSMSNLNLQEPIGSFSDAKVKLTVIDRDHSALSRALTGYLYDRHTEIPLSDDTETLQDALYQRSTEYILIVPSGYEQSVLGTGEPLGLDVAQVPDSYAGAYVDRQVNNFISTVQVYLSAGTPAAQALYAAAQDLSASVKVSMQTQARTDLPAEYYFFKFLSYAFMMLMIFGLCPVLIVFGNRNLSLRLHSSPLPLRSRNRGLFAGAATLAAASLAVFLLFGFALYGQKMLTAAALICMGNALVFLLLSTSMAFLIGQLCKTVNMVSAIANVTVLAQCFLCGVFVPMELMGSGIETAAKFLPTYWYVQATEQAFRLTQVSLQSLQPILESIVLQLVFTAALLAAALAVSKQKQQVK